jgi:hypothetical protein
MDAVWKSHNPASHARRVPSRAARHPDRLLWPMLQMLPTEETNDLPDEHDVRRRMGAGG